MLPAPTLESITNRLKGIDYEEGGPDGVRYVCVLFFNYHGYRILYNMYSAKDWGNWSTSSGELWDLFLAGCYQYGRGPEHYGARALPLTEGRTPFYWSSQQTELLTQTFRRNSVHTTSHQSWSFAGPLELVVVGARKCGQEIDFDWPGMRALQLSDQPLGQIVADYTEVHFQNDPELLSPGLPAPGDFHNDVTLRDSFEAVVRLLPFIRKVFHFYKMLHAG